MKSGLSVDGLVVLESIFKKSMARFQRQSSRVFVFSRIFCGLLPYAAVKERVKYCIEENPESLKIVENGRFVDTTSLWASLRRAAAISFETVESRASRKA